MGYSRAGFEVVGVDIKPQSHYPFEFVQADAFRAFQIKFWADFDAIHASPPCQAYSTLKARWQDREHPDLIQPTRELLEQTGLPYVIENVEGAPLLNPAKLCGSWFGLDVRRHRLFETNWSLMSTPCSHHWQQPRFGIPDKRREAASAVVPVFGTGRQVWTVNGEDISIEEQRTLQGEAMGIDWMTPYELTQAIPPAYTELIGHQLLQHIRAEAVA